MAEAPVSATGSLTAKSSTLSMSKACGGLREEPVNNIKKERSERGTVKEASSPSTPDCDEDLSLRLTVKSLIKPPFTPKKSDKTPTRPNFQLPGERFSKRQQVMKERKLREEQEELKRKREFKAAKVCCKHTPVIPVRENAASRARINVKQELRQRAQQLDLRKSDASPSSKSSLTQSPVSGALTKRGTSSSSPSKGAAKNSTEIVREFTKQTPQSHDDSLGYADNQSPSHAIRVRSMQSQRSNPRRENHGGPQNWLRHQYQLDNSNADETAGKVRQESEGQGQTTQQSGMTDLTNAFKTMKCTK
ncbi:hypothetical protein KEM54_003119 [Ascosphaera aggregata]|nr:hypothetical protein KEM54_003119 [Ascosphaera aggregata]